MNHELRWIDRRDREMIHQASWILKRKGRDVACRRRIPLYSSAKYNARSHERESLRVEEKKIGYRYFDSRAVHSLPEPAYGANAKTTSMPLSTTVASPWLMDLSNRSYCTMEIFLKFPFSEYNVSINLELSNKICPLFLFVLPLDIFHTQKKFSTISKISKYNISINLQKWLKLREVSFNLNEEKKIMELQRKVVSRVGQESRENSRSRDQTSLGMNRFSPRMGR